MTVAYQFSPLKPNENSIRLLQIDRGLRSHDITCWLFESYADREKAPAYKALSYTWGGPEPTMEGSCILIDGHEFRDEREKGHQVKQMADVYTAAEEVLIWLGPINDDIISLMESITWIDNSATKAQAIGSNEDWTSLCRRFMCERPLSLVLETDSRQKRALEALLGRPWFNRVWILQEVAKARTANIMCGSYSCPARTFALMPSLMGLEVNEHIQAVLDIMPRFRRGTWWSSKRYLHFLLHKFAESQASVARDKIYALLGMSEDACNPERFYPCYEKSDVQVFRDTACFLLFGEILDSSHSFPEFTLPELCLPIIQLAEKALVWTLSQREGLRGSAHRTAILLARRMNEGQLKIGDLLLSLAEKYNRVNDIRNLLSHGNVDISVNSENERNALTITSTEESTLSVSLNFPREQSSETELEYPPPPFKENENMAETISRLIETGSSKEEILRAHVWAGDKEAVLRQLLAGADVNGRDINGSTALHFASWQRNQEIVKLLLLAGADVNGTDIWKQTALHYAVRAAPELGLLISK
ncbi:heterokaryon incompatibility protein-domain-containing protein [Xylaria venustula]|nr:heterokaryon incompatibility protein-domain-containing protein [Xylaria venustula]